MRVLGIETSCDETAAAILTEGWRLESNVIASQAELHEPYGGVVPEIASRRHVEIITLVVEEALRQAGATLTDIEGIAVTNRPGLIGSLLVGVTAAKGIALSLGLPLVGVHHLEGHIFGAMLAAGGPRFPAVALIASGGHTELFYVRKLHDYLRMGRRLDDAAGEAFDKGARALGLGHGGGAALERLARQGRPDAVHFPRARTQGALDFSFSGLKTALLRQIANPAEGCTTADLAAAYQASLIDTLVSRSVEAVRVARVRHLLLGGGVAANGALQAALRDAAERHGFELHMPSRELCTDNAAMIAAAGHSLLDSGVRDELDLETLPRAPLTTLVF